MLNAVALAQASGSTNGTGVFTTTLTWSSADTTLNPAGYTVEVDVYDETIDQ